MPKADAGIYGSGLPANERTDPRLSASDSCWCPSGFAFVKGGDLLGSKLRLHGARMSTHRHHLHRWRHRAYQILEHGLVGDRAMRVTSGLIIFLVLVNILAVVLESVPRYEAAYGRLFEAIELVSLVAFTIEYLLRIWAAPEHAAYRELKPLEARLRYATSIDGLIDLFSALPFWFAFVLPSELRIILLFRVVRFLKLARYSPAAALAVGGALCRAASAVRVRRDLRGRDADQRHVCPSCRARCAAWQVRHYSGCHVVVDRDARHHRVR
jgi:Ion transport protein